VPLENTFQDLTSKLRELREHLGGLQVTVVEDRPLHDVVKLVDRLGEIIEDLLGHLEEALAAAAKGQQAVAHPVDLDRARRALTACQERYNSLAQRFTCDLVCYETIEELTGLGRARRGEWLAWAKTVRESLRDCQQSSYEVSQALFRCWQSIAERVGANSVSVQATNIGQQITVPEGSDLAGRSLP